eukprot:5437356-Pyramimonas_sp.AAC.1
MVDRGDHGRLMCTHQSRPYEVCIYAAHRRREASAPEDLRKNSVYMQMAQYYRFWSVGHNNAEYR